MKKSILIVTIIIICVLVVTAIVVINMNRKVGPGLPSDDNEAQTPGCMYVYKTNQDYFPYVAGLANNRTGIYKLVSWPVNYDDEQLSQGYIFGGGGCISNNQSITSDWVILDIKKSELYKDLGYSGCLELEKQTYPQCYGENKYKQGQNSECDIIYEQESNSDTSICSSHSVDTENILVTDVITEFYVCKYSVGTTAEEYNNIINNGQLNSTCTKLV